MKEEPCPVSIQWPDHTNDNYSVQKWFIIFVLSPAAAPATGNCLRKWGMFPKIGGTCGQFVQCVDGREFELTCPDGLAWHNTLWFCDWPDQVPNCNAEGKYLNFCI